MIVPGSAVHHPNGASMTIDEDRGVANPVITPPGHFPSIDLHRLTSTSVVDRDMPTSVSPGGLPRVFVHH